MQPCNALTRHGGGAGVCHRAALSITLLETKLPAPVLALLLGAAMKWFALTHPEVIDTSEWRRLGGIACAVVSAAIALSAFFVMRRARTTINPFSPTRASQLVTSGPFRFSRNPLYLSLLLLLVGYAFRLDAWFIWLSPALFLAYVTCFQIVPEERALRHQFGDAFARYCERTRRWL